MRWAQLNSTEDDAAEMDIPFWMDYFKRIHADALCITAGGVVAFYPTKIQYHRPSRWLAQRPDYFRQVIEGCRKLGMVVVARTDPHATYEDVYHDHPDWIAVDAEGRKRRHWEMPDMWVTCALGPYNFEFMTEVHEGDRLDVPRGGRHFQQSLGRLRHVLLRALPRGTSATTAAWTCRAPTTSTIRRGATTSSGARSGCSSCGGCGTARSARSIPPRATSPTPAAPPAASTCSAVGELAPTLFADRQGRSGVMAPWANGKNGKEYRSTLGRKPIGGIFHMGVVAPHRWPDSVQNGNETRIWVLDGIANGLRPWFNKFGAQRPRPPLAEGRRGPVRLALEERALPAQRGAVARVGLVYSQQTTTWYGGPQARQKVEDHSLGMYQALVEARMPFEMVHDRTARRRRGPLQTPAPAQHRRSVGRAVRAAPRVRRARRQRRGDL